MSCPISLHPAARADIQSLGRLLAPWRLQGVTESQEMRQQWAAFLPPQDIVLEWKNPSSPYCLCVALPVISLSALRCFCPALSHWHFGSAGSGSGPIVLRGVLSLQVDPEPILSLSANTKKDQPIHPVWMEERLEVKGLRSVLRDRMIPSAFRHPYPAMHRTKLSSPCPGARDSCSLLGVLLQEMEMRHLLGSLFAQMLGKFPTGAVERDQNQRASPGLPCSLHPYRAKCSS